MVLGVILHRLVFGGVLYVVLGQRLFRKGIGEVLDMVLGVILHRLVFGGGLYVVLGQRLFRKEIGEVLDMVLGVILHRMVFGGVLYVVLGDKLHRLGFGGVLYVVLGDKLHRLGFGEVLYVVLGDKLHRLELGEVLYVVLGVALHRFRLKRVPGCDARSDTAPGGPLRGCARRNIAPGGTREFMDVVIEETMHQVGLEEFLGVVLRETLHRGLTRSRAGCGTGEKISLHVLEIRSKALDYVTWFTIFVVLDFNMSLRHTGEIFLLIRKK